MKNLILLITIIFNAFVANSQTISVDTIIKQKKYTSYFSYTLKTPLYVSYLLYKGGGECDRTGYRFQTGGVKNSQDAYDYKGSGYDEGHLANAEDFSYNCIYDEQTFRFYNCLPQTPNLNRGCWKSDETKIRSQSQTDSLFIVCGGLPSTKKLEHGAVVPDKFWKVVYSKHKKNFTLCRIYTNTDNATATDISINELITELKKVYGNHFDLLKIIHDSNR